MASLFRRCFPSLASDSGGTSDDDDMSSPRTLEDLLHHFHHLPSLTLEAADEAIEANAWARGFRDYLHQRDLDDEATILRFLVLTQPLHPPKQKKAAAAAAKLSKQEQQELYVLVGRTFFSEESETPLTLKNSQLFMKIFRAAERLQRPGGSLQPEDLKSLSMARTDANVMQNGLEPKFKIYVSQARHASTPIGVACLLSIL